MSNDTVSWALWWAQEQHKLAAVADQRARGRGNLKEPREALQEPREACARAAAAYMEVANAAASWQAGWRAVARAARAKRPVLVPRFSPRATVWQPAPAQSIPQTGMAEAKGAMEQAAARARAVEPYAYQAHADEVARAELQNAARGAFAAYRALAATAAAHAGAWENLERHYGGEAVAWGWRLSWPTRQYARQVIGPRWAADLARAMGDEPPAEQADRLGRLRAAVETARPELQDDEWRRRRWLWACDYLGAEAAGGPPPAPPEWWREHGRGPAPTGSAYYRVAEEAVDERPDDGDVFWGWLGAAAEAHKWLWGPLPGTRHGWAGGQVLVDRAHYTLAYLPAAAECELPALPKTPLPGGDGMAFGGTEAPVRAEDLDQAEEAACLRVQRILDDEDAAAKAEEAKAKAEEAKAKEDTRRAKGIASGARQSATGKTYPKGLAMR